jgi:hypothetical protein
MKMGWGRIGERIARGAVNNFLEERRETAYVVINVTNSSVCRGCYEIAAVKSSCSMSTMPHSPLRMHALSPSLIDAHYSLLL